MTASTPLCLTVDVEDWYEGMDALGKKVPRVPVGKTGIAHLREMLTGASAAGRITCFVVAKHASAYATELQALASDGHEIASHGFDHGLLPSCARELERWLREGKERLEDVVQQPVRGFRSPRFDVPAGWDLEGFRAAIADTGFTYVSDTHTTPTHPRVAELPVLTWKGLPLGGGSYQRVLPGRLLDRALRAPSKARVLYYHSYDFGAELPPTSSSRSLREFSQLAARSRIAAIFQSLLARFGSVTCTEVVARGL